MMAQHPEKPWSDESIDLLTRITKHAGIILSNATTGIASYSVVESMLRDLMQEAKTFQYVLSEADYRTHQTVIVRSNGHYCLTHFPVDSTPQDSDSRRNLFAQIGEFFHGLQSLEGLDGTELRSKGIPVLKALSQSMIAAGEEARKTFSPDIEYLERRRKSKEDKAKDLNSQEDLDRRMTSEARTLEKFSNVEPQNLGVQLKNSGRTIDLNNKEFMFTPRQAPLIRVFYDNYLEGNDFISEQEVLEKADQAMLELNRPDEATYSKTRFEDIFRSRWEIFLEITEKHPDDPSLRRLKID